MIETCSCENEHYVSSASLTKGQVNTATACQPRWGAAVLCHRTAFRHLLKVSTLKDTTIIEIFFVCIT